jgi:putative DNA primase/helicase
MTAAEQRQQQLAERERQVELLRGLPAQWLLWKLEMIEGRNGLQKVPYYVNGGRRYGKLGGEEDLGKLASFDAALARFKSSFAFAGVGFAFLNGGGIVGVDLDDMADQDTGELRPHHREIIDACSSYTEFSPSGKGVHVIVSGSCDSFKHDDCGVEVYSGDRWFACTGAHYGGTPHDVLPLKPAALAYLRQVVQESKDAAKAARAAAQGGQAAAADGELAAVQAPVPGPAPASGGNDFRRVNDAAQAAPQAWVPRLFPAARVWNNGYRIRSKDLGRDLEEDLQITPDGVMDFGEEHGMSPIDVVLKWQPGCSTPKDALQWLAAQLGIQLAGRQRPKLRAVTGMAPGPEPDGPGPAAAGAETPPPTSPVEPDAPADGGRGDGGKKKRPPEFWDNLDALRDTFALIYGTDTVYDGKNGLIMKIANMAHAHGSELVKFWKNSTASALRSGGGRWTVMPENVVFDPTETVDTDTHINLFRGFALEPQAGSVAPFLDLIRHLCSRAGDSEETCDEVMDYLLSWMAWPLQHRGAKLRTAVVMHGDEGAGKNFLFDLLVEIYGEYGATVGQDELEDKFNDWRSRKLMVVGDEVSSRAELVHNKNRLKALITSTTVQINPKNLPRREEANHINVVFLSNELQPLALDNSDRRYLVIFTPKAREFEFYAALGEWRKKGGAARLYHYLLNYDCSKFDPFAPAPITSAKRDLIDLNRKSPERFWVEWSEGQIDLPYWSCTGEQAYRAYLKYAQRTGDRFPVQRPLFTRMLLRISDTMGRACVDKVMKIDRGTETAPDQRTTRMLLVKPPPDDNQGAWATDCWRLFEVELRKYLGGRFGGQDGGEGDEP